MGAGRHRSVASADLSSDYSRDAYLLFVAFRLPRVGDIYLLPIVGVLSSVSVSPRLQPPRRQLTHINLSDVHLTAEILRNDAGPTIKLTTYAMDAPRSAL